MKTALCFFFVFLSVACSSEKKTFLKDDIVTDADIEQVSECGNGVRNEGEVCDGTTLKCINLDPEKYRQGFAFCKDDCSGYNVSSCLEVYQCGNNIVEPGEVCDGSFKPCKEIDPVNYHTGFATCFKYCNGWDSSKCKEYYVCGNGVKEIAEACEIGQEKECRSLIPDAFYSGKAVCNEYCSNWDYSGCIPHDCADQECGIVERTIGQIDYQFSCGECSGGDICNLFNQCEFPCKDSKCGEVKITDNDGVIHEFTCRDCPQFEYCSTENRCVQACSDMACGIDHGVNCGVCPDGYYCSTFPNRCRKMPDIEFATIPEGEFFMGCNEEKDSSCSEVEKPGHLIKLDSYMIGAFEVTVEQYGYCVDAGICQAKNDSDSHFKTYSYNFRCNYMSGKPLDHPMNCVNFYGAEAFCSFIGGRLPTEAEWEKAARGGCEFYDNCGIETIIYPWGDDPASCDNAVVRDMLSGIPGCEYDGTMPVGSKPAGVSPYGLYDMSGNVWEWTNDWFEAAYYFESPYENPQGPETGREKVLKGGSCNFTSKAVRPSYRYNVYPTLTYTYGGFRCVKDIE